MKSAIINSNSSNIELHLIKDDSENIYISTNENNFIKFDTESNVNTYKALLVLFDAIEKDNKNKLLHRN